MKIGIWINSAGLSNLGRLSFELGSAHEQFGVWTGGPNFTKKIWLWQLSNQYWHRKNVSCCAVVVLDFVYIREVAAVFFRLV